MPAGASDCGRRERDDSYRLLARSLGALLVDLAVLDPDLARTARGIARLMRDHHQRCPSGALDLEQEIEDRLCIDAVEIAGGLVGKDERGVC